MRQRFVQIRNASSRALAAIPFWSRSAKASGNAHYYPAIDDNDDGNVTNDGTRTTRTIKTSKIEVVLLLLLLVPLFHDVEAQQAAAAVCSSLRCGKAVVGTCAAPSNDQSRSGGDGGSGGSGGDGGGGGGGDIDADAVSLKVAGNPLGHLRRPTLHRGPRPQTVSESAAVILASCGSCDPAPVMVLEFPCAGECTCPTTSSWQCSRRRHIHYRHR